MALWATVPADLVHRFRPHVEPLARDMLREIQLAVPAYALPLRGEFGRVMVTSVEQSILRFLRSIDTAGARDDSWAAVFRQLGRLEYEQGRSLDHLQTAYRVGARVAWRHVAAFGQQQRIPAAVYSIAAEAIFAYVDELSTLSIEGYTAAQTAALGSVERQRRRLLELILAEPQASAQVIARQADQAGWRLSAEITVVALEPRDDQHQIPSPVLHEDVLVDFEGSQPCLITADPEQHLRQLARQLGGWRACIGPMVPLSDAALSLRTARRTMRLVQRGIIPDRPLTFYRDHVSELCLLADEFLMSRLVAHSLAPMEDLTVKQRERTSQTLLAWLETRGGAPEIAQRLKIHPQTVRYRMRQLEKLFGDQLNNPDGRLNLELALRARQLLASAKNGSPAVTA